MKNRSLKAAVAGLACSVGTHILILLIITFCCTLEVSDGLIIAIMTAVYLSLLIYAAVCAIVQAKLEYSPIFPLTAFVGAALPALLFIYIITVNISNEFLERVFAIYLILLSIRVWWIMGILLVIDGIWLLGRFIYRKLHQG